MGRKADLREEIELHMQSGQTITFVPEKKRGYTPSQMFCLMRGMDIENETDMTWAKKYCQRSAAASGRS